MQTIYKLGDVVDSDFMKFPLTLLADKKYREMSIEAKVIYSLLLNRLSLSQKNNWVNENNEVYIIYTREEAANMLNISYKKAISGFKELISNHLIIEQRRGRGFPNLIYLIKAETSDEDAEQFQNSFNRASEQSLDMQLSDIKTCKNVTSRHADLTAEDMPLLYTTKNNKINTYKSQSVCPSGCNNYDSEILDAIYEKCELDRFDEQTEAVYRNAIDRLYFAKSYRLCNSEIPSFKIREYLDYLDSDIFTEVNDIIIRNDSRVQNTTGYIMSVILNAIFEKQSDIIVNLPHNYLIRKE